MSLFNSKEPVNLIDEDKYLKYFFISVFLLFTNLPLMYHFSSIGLYNRILEILLTGGNLDTDLVLIQALKENILGLFPVFVLNIFVSLMFGIFFRVRSMAYFMEIERGKPLSIRFVLEDFYKNAIYKLKAIILMDIFIGAIIFIFVLLSFVLVSLTLQSSDTLNRISSIYISIASFFIFSSIYSFKTFITMIFCYISYANNISHYEVNKNLFYSILILIKENFLDFCKKTLLLGLLIAFLGAVFLELRNILNDYSVLSLTCFLLFALFNMVTLSIVSKSINTYIDLYVKKHDTYYIQYLDKYARKTKISYNKNKYKLRPEAMPEEEEI